MITILVRTLLVYLSLNVVMRLMGKRQIGEMEVTDLVTTLLISEIASLPVTNLDIPLSYALIPMAVLLALEVGSSTILMFFPGSKTFLSSRPAVLIQNGVLNQKMLKNTRLTPEELMGEIRESGLTDFSQVKDAILEKDGKVTILPFVKYAPPTAENLHLTLPEERLSHVVFCFGKICPEGLSLIGKEEKWLLKEMERRGVSLDSVFCITADDSGSIHYIIKEEKK